LLIGAYNDDVFKYHDNALVEVWIGRTAVNVGDVTGSNLYSTMLKSIRNKCRDNGSKKCTIDWNSVPTYYSYQDDTFNHNWGVRDSMYWSCLESFAGAH
jgi:hypothetical protein